MTVIDETKPLNRLLLEDDHDDLEFHPPRTRRDGAGAWKRKQQNFRFNEAFGPEPVMDRIRESWTRGKLLEEGGDALFETRAGVGRDQVNGQIDMAKVESLLEQAGAIDLTGYKGPTGLFSYDKEDAIKDFQAGNNLKIDGKIMPNGQTMRALRAQLTAPVKTEATDKPEPDRVQFAANISDGAVTNDAAGGLLGIGATDPDGEGNSVPDSIDKNPAPFPLARHYGLPAPLGVLNWPTDKNPSKHDLDRTEKRMRGYVTLFRKRGWHPAADHLERFLDGSGKELNLTREEMREFEMFRNAEAGNRDRFETGAFLAKAKKNESNNEKLRNLKDGGKVTITDHYIHFIGLVRGLPIALSSGPNSYLSFGDTHIKSSATINARREGNIIHYHGVITHTLNDPFDFKKGQPGAGDALKLQKHRGAKPFDMKAKWQQKFSGTVEISNGVLSNPKFKWWDIEMEKSK